MREFVYFSQQARTSGNFKDLMQAGRLDIACHVLIAAFFLSHKIRQNVKLHMIFNGPPDPPKHLEFVYDKDMPISKKDVAKLIKIMLFKYKKGKKVRVFPGCFIEKKSFQELVKEFINEGKTLYLLDKKGKDIRNIQIENNAVFILGDHQGLPKMEKRFIKRYANLINVGPYEYFSSQVIVLVNNELDRRSYI